MKWLSIGIVIGLIGGLVIAGTVAKREDVREFQVKAHVMCENGYTETQYAMAEDHYYYSVAQQDLNEFCDFRNGLIPRP